MEQKDITKYRHKDYETIKNVLIKTDIPILLVGEAGTGKTTVAQQLATELGLPFTILSLNKQVSKGDIVGFKSINGNYISTMFREAYEQGHLILLDEIDAADPNTLLTLNTMENGYVSFPDGLIHAHKDTKVIATANPFTEHSQYTGRSKLDFSTINRYWVAHLDRDPELEKNLTSVSTAKIVDLIRANNEEKNLNIPVTMREALKFDVLKDLLPDAIPKVFFAEQDTTAYTAFVESNKEKLDLIAIQQQFEKDGTVVIASFKEYITSVLIQGEDFVLDWDKKVN